MRSCGGESGHNGGGVRQGGIRWDRRPPLRWRANVRQGGVGGCDRVWEVVGRGSVVGPHKHKQRCLILVPLLSPSIRHVLTCHQSIIVGNSRRLGASLRWTGLRGPVIFIFLAIGPSRKTKNSYNQCLDDKEVKRVVGL